MNQKPKRKPKNKNLNIDEQIEHLLDDEEYIIWSEQTQKHYFDFSVGQIGKAINPMTAFVAFFVVSLFVLNVQSFVIDILGFWLLMLIPTFGFLRLVTSQVREFLNYVNVITNYQILVYDPNLQNIVVAFEHDNVQRFRVHEYGENMGSIMIDRQSERKKEYRVTPTHPLEFTLNGINDLSKVTGLLRSQLGIEPEYLQIHQKRK